MKHWPYIVGSHSHEAVRAAVRDEQWQSFRKSLKGKPTNEKLLELERYLLVNCHDRIAKVRIDNYINALKRGGQLDSNLDVQR